MGDRIIKRSVSNNDLHSTSNRDFTRGNFKAKAHEFEELRLTTTTNGVEGEPTNSSIEAGYHASPYLDFLRQEEERPKEAKVDPPTDSDSWGQTKLSIHQWLKTQGQQLDLPLETRAKDQPETSDNSSLERLFECSKRFSDLNKSFKVLEQDMRQFLDLRAQENFSQDLAGKCKKVQEAFTAARDHSTRASSDQNFAEAINEFKGQLDSLEGLKRTAMSGILGRRFADIDTAYKGLKDGKAGEDNLDITSCAAVEYDGIREKAAEGLEGEKRKEAIRKLGVINRNSVREDGTFYLSKARELELSYQRRANQISSDYENLSSNFESLEKKIPKTNYDISTYTECMDHLKKMDSFLYTTMRQLKYPPEFKEASEKMELIRADADAIDLILSGNKTVKNPYDQETLEYRFGQVEQKIVRGLLTTRRISTASLFKVQGDIDQDIGQLASDVDQALKCCQKVSKIREQVRYITAILEQLKPSESPDPEWHRQFQKQEDDALREAIKGDHGQAFDTLDRFTAKIREKAERCQHVDEVDMGVRDHLITIDSILAKHNKLSSDSKKASLEANMQAEASHLTTTPTGIESNLDDISKSFNTAAKQELRQKGGDALQEAIEGEHGPAFGALDKFASKVRGKAERCQNVDMVEMKVRSNIERFNHVLAKYGLNDISESFNTAVEQELRQKGGDALREAIEGEHGPAFGALDKFASKVRKLEDSCNSANLKIGELEPKSLTKALPEAVKQEFRQMLGDALQEFWQKGDDALQEGAQGITEQALDTLDKFASEVHELRVCSDSIYDNLWDALFKLDDHDLKDAITPVIQAVGKKLQQKLDGPLQALQEGTQGITGQAFDILNQFATELHKPEEDCKNIFSDISFVKDILQSHNLDNISASFDESVKEELQQKLGGTQQEGTQVTAEQAFDTLNQCASRVRKVKEDCDTINKIVLQLRNSNGTEADDLNQQHSVALVEAVQGSSERPAFKVLEQEFDQEMLKRFYPYKYKIRAMQLIYQYSLDFKTEYPGSSIALHRMDDDDKDDYIVSIELLSKLEKLSNQFEEQRKNAPKKSDSERTSIVRVLMETLSGFDEESIPQFEEQTKELINHRFNASQTTATATNYWRDLHPDQTLVKKYKEASDAFRNVSAAIEEISGDSRIHGIASLGKFLHSVESLEGQINLDKSKRRKRKW